MFTRHIKMTVFALSVLVFSSASATTYYVAANGSDTTGNGTLTYPWKTIQKAADNMLNAGDVCKIRTGTYRETVTVKASNLTFQAYNDELVTISGVDVLPVSGQSWTQESANIYYTPMNWTLNDGNQVFQSSAMKPEARWPNNSDMWQGSRPKSPSSTTYTNTWSYLDSAGYPDGINNGWFIDAALPDNIVWPGCTVHIMSGHGWIMAHPTITAYDNTLHKLTTNDNCGSEPAYTFYAGNEYYITGNKDLMDSTGKWFYDPVNSRIYFYSSAMPANVEAKKRSYGFDISGKSHINLKNLDFFACTVKTDSNSTNCTFDGLSMQYLNHSSGNSSFCGIILFDNSVLRNSELAFDSQGLVELAGNDIRIINNHLHDSGYVPYWTATLSGDGFRNLISHNTLHDSGRALVGFLGQAAICEYNDMYTAMKLTTDGALLYSNKDADNTIFRYNLLHDSYGSNGHSGGVVQGFYLDCFSTNWIIHHNIIWNVSGYGIQINNRHNFNMIFNNTCWNAGQGPFTAGFSSYVDGKSGTRIFNNIFTGYLAGYWENNTDVAYNLYCDPLLTDSGNEDFRLQTSPILSPAVDAGITIPGITDGYQGNAPDIGAMESGKSNWATSCGYRTTPPSPDPVYDFPTMLFCNQVKNGGFESESFTDWNTTGSVSLCYDNSWISGANTRTGWNSAEFSGNEAEISQTANNLESNQHYIFYVSVKKQNANDDIAIGVRNYGGSELTVSASAQDTGWNMYSLPFATGTSNTSAQIFIYSVDIDTAVHVDDASVEFYPSHYDNSYPIPVVYYKLNENSGLTAYDSADDLNGTLYGSMTDSDWISAKFGNGIDLDGTDDYIDCGNNSSLQLTRDLTLSFWIKPDDISIHRQNPLDKRYNGEFSLCIFTTGNMHYYHHRDAADYWIPWSWEAFPHGKIQEEYGSISQSLATRRPGL